MPGKSGDLDIASPWLENRERGRVQGTAFGRRDAVEALPGKGVSKAELSRRFGVSRRTIHAWIESGESDRDLATGRSRHARRPRPAHKLDAYEEIIEARLAEFPRLSARRLFDLHVFEEA